LAGVVRGIAGVVAVTVGLSACGRDRFDPHSPEVERNRQARTTTVTTTAARVFDGLPDYGRSRYDACESGQNNNWVHDPYRQRCGFAFRAVAGMRATTMSFVIVEARQHLDHAGCTGTGSTDPDRFGFTIRTGRPAGLWGGAFVCDGLEWLFVVGKTDDSRFASQVGDSLAGPYGTTVERQNIDAAKAFVDASRDRHQYVLVADTAGDYYVQPREVG
jgi:hypothetical protein